MTPEMTPIENKPYYQEFTKLLNAVEERFDDMKQQIRQLKEENRQLRHKLKEVQEGQTDIFSAMTEKDRIALRQQIKGYIEKIDHHLESMEDQQ